MLCDLCALGQHRMYITLSGCQLNFNYVLLLPVIIIYVNCPSVQLGLGLTLIIAIMWPVFVHYYNLTKMTIENSWSTSSQAHWACSRASEHMVICLGFIWQYFSCLRPGNILYHMQWSLYYNSCTIWITKEGWLQYFSFLIGLLDCLYYSVEEALCRLLVKAFFSITFFAW